MKKSIILATLFINMICAQNPYATNKDCQEALKKLEFMAGTWKGEAKQFRGPNTLVINQEENVQLKLDGTVLLVEGTGRDIKTNDISFNALAIISYDATKKMYAFKSFMKNGQQIDAYFNVLADNKFEWGFDMAQGKVKYTITLDSAAKTWTEIGEFSRDAGITWMKSSELNLKKN